MIYLSFGSEFNHFLKRVPVKGPFPFPVRSQSGPDNLKFQMWVRDVRRSR